MEYTFKIILILLLHVKMMQHKNNLSKTNNTKFWKFYIRISIK